MEIEKCIITWLEQIKQILADYPGDLKLIEICTRTKNIWLRLSEQTT